MLNLAIPASMLDPRGPLEEVTGGEVPEAAGGGGEVVVPVPDDAEGALAARGVEVEPGDWRVGGDPACACREQSDTHSRADQLAGPVGVLAFAGADRVDCRGGRELAGKRSLPATAA